jgi:hypothetical protein
MKNRRPASTTSNSTHHGFRAASTYNSRRRDNTLKVRNLSYLNKENFPVGLMRKPGYIYYFHLAAYFSYLEFLDNERNYRKLLYLYP